MRLLDDQRVRFVVVGSVNTALAFVYFIALQLTLGRIAPYLVVLVVAHVLQVLTAFTTQRLVVFRVRGHLWLDLARFELVNLGALGVNAVLLVLLVERGGLTPIPGQLVAGSVVVVMTFFLHRGFSFRRPHADAAHTSRAGAER